MIEPTRIYPVRAVDTLHEAGYEVAELGLEITERMTVRQQLDARSDAQLMEAARLARDLERLSPIAAPIARLIRERIARGLELDALEDPHCTRVAEAGAEVEARGRCVVVGLKTWVVQGDGPEGGEAA